MRLTKLDVNGITKVNQAFTQAANAFKLLVEFHEKTPGYLSQTYQVLVQRYSDFAKYEETRDIKKLKEAFQKISSLMIDSSLYQVTDSLMEIAKHIFNA
ncbi:hypothetical protein IM40_00545 [Candidatus Paracaedimonas acanthamoebae]|nr:hypothetical protein IM40_00545 [Candidatus Paracaedimonas acanthamoebae]